MTALYAELIAAFILLSRLPIGGFGDSPAQDAFAGAVWAYPIVGATIGAIGAAVYIACRWIGLPTPLAAICCLGAIVVATGGLHEVALADTADGFGGGRSRTHKLEIMRDSRVGTFGVLALVFTLAARGAAIASIAVPGKVATALIAAGGLGRGTMVVPLLLLTPARADGLGARLANTSKARSIISLALAAAVPLLLLPIGHALCAVAMAILVGLGMSVLAWRQIGGYTGDVLGTTEVMAECSVLLSCAAIGTVSAP